MKRGKKKLSKAKKPYEFFQKVILLNWALTAFWITASYLLAFYAIAHEVTAPEINSAVTLALVSESLGVTLAYAITNASLKKNLNNNKLAIDEERRVYPISSQSGSRQSTADEGNAR
ncbi:MAG: hypothetical protein LBT88_06580 [Oscillospiraceae bacterium]|jgi:hypothetical protein|nr:hypothetical protein [Oscillospiraceae bacterium]